MKLLRVSLLSALFALLAYQARALLHAPVSLLSEAVFLGVITLLVVGCLFWLMPDAVTRLRTDPDLLLPLVCLVLFRASTDLFLNHVASRVEGLAPLAMRLAQGKPYEVFVLLSEAVYATWITLLLSRLKRSPGLRPEGTIRHIALSFGCILTCYAGSIGVLLAVVLLAPPLLMPIADWLVPYLLAAFAIFWNLYTAALVTESVHEKYSYLQRLRSGIVHAGSGMLRWTLPVTAQLALVGIVTYVSAAPFARSTVTWITDAGRPGLHAMWFGGYSDICWWYHDRMLLAHTSSTPIILTLLSLLFGVLSLAVRLTVLQRTNPLTQTSLRIPAEQELY